MSLVRGLQCKECHREYPKSAVYVCEYCFGPLEVGYDYDAIMGRMTREAIESRPRNLWRYRELLPIDGEPQVGSGLHALRAAFGQCRRPFLIRGPAARRALQDGPNLIPAQRVPQPGQPFPLRRR